MSQHHHHWKKDPFRDHGALSAIPRGGGEGGTPPGFLRRTFPSFPWMRLPNMLTYARCIAIPLLVFCYYAQVPFLTAGNNRPIILASIFAIASLTDWLDGFLARRWNVTSPFGAFLDPVADKLMVSTALILLAGSYGQNVSIPCAIILAREIAVSALREWMAQRGLRDVVKVGFQGKVKTAATMVALTLLLAAGKGEGWLFKLGMGGLYLSAVVTVTSGSVYFSAAGPVLMGAAAGEEPKEDAPAPAVVEVAREESVKTDVVGQYVQEVEGSVDQSE